MRVNGSSFVEKPYSNVLPSLLNKGSNILMIGKKKGPHYFRKNCIKGVFLVRNDVIIGCKTRVLFLC